MKNCTLPLTIRIDVKRSRSTAAIIHTVNVAGSQRVVEESTAERYHEMSMSHAQRSLGCQITTRARLVAVANNIINKQQARRRDRIWRHVWTQAEPWNNGNVMDTIAAATAMADTIPRAREKTRWV